MSTLSIRPLQAPHFLIPEITVHENGTGPVLDLGPDSGPVLITLGMLDVVEQESLLLSVHGSLDGADWLPEPLTSFPEKFYPGVSAVYLDPATRPIRFIRAQWKVNRWGRGSKIPMFKFYVFAEAL